MGRGTVKAKGNRIEYAFFYRGKRWRPTKAGPPTEKKLRQAEIDLQGILRRIERGTFVFEDEFPDYRLAKPTSQRTTFNSVADSFLKATKGDLANATWQTYRKLLTIYWRPEFGAREFLSIKANEIHSFVGSTVFRTVKYRNNVVSAGKRVFDYGYNDHPERASPAAKLKSLRVQRPKPDPFTLDEAERIIAGMREAYGAHDANYIEFQFFAGARPSETIALKWERYDKAAGLLRVREARVWGKDKPTTKTSVERDVELNGRAKAALERQRLLTGLLPHGYIFTRSDGAPWHDLQVQWKRWKPLLAKLKIRYREPYQMRHTSVTWNLMAGKNLMWVAQNHGHSAAVMLKTYARWMAGTSPAEVARIAKALDVVTVSSDSYAQTRTNLPS